MWQKHNKLTQMRAVAYWPDAQWVVQGGFNKDFGQRACVCLCIGGGATRDQQMKVTKRALREATND